MEPNTQAPGFNPDQNPFAEIMNQGGGMMPQGQPMMAPQGAPSPMGGPAAPGVAPEDPNNPLVQGQTGDGAKSLVSAIQALHNYIGFSTNPQQINLIRNIITMITKLVDNDQKVASQKTMEASKAPQQAPSLPAVSQ